MTIGFDISKMSSSDIGDRAMRIFAYQLSPSFKIRSQEDQNDYGIDGEIEEVSFGIASANIFKFQLKGSSSLTYLKDGEVSFQLDVEKILYYSKIDLPVVLLVVDIKKDIVYWEMIQNERLIEKAFEYKKKGMTKINIHINPLRTIQGDFDGLIKKIERYKVLLSSRKIMSTGFPSVFDSLSCDDNAFKEQYAFVEDQHKKLKITKIFREYMSNDDDVALQSSYSVLRSEELDLNTRFIAYLYAYQILNRRVEIDGVDSVIDLTDKIISIMRGQVGSMSKEMLAYISLIRRASRCDVISNSMSKNEYSDVEYMINKYIDHVYKLTYMYSRNFSMGNFRHVMIENFNSYFRHFRKAIKILSINGYYDLAFDLNSFCISIVDDILRLIDLNIALDKPMKKYGVMIKDLESIKENLYEEKLQLFVGN